MGAAAYAPQHSCSGGQQHMHGSTEVKLAEHVGLGYWSRGDPRPFENSLQPFGCLSSTFGTHLALPDNHGFVCLCTVSMWKHCGTGCGTYSVGICNLCWKARGTLHKIEVFKINPDRPLFGTSWDITWNHSWLARPREDFVSIVHNLNGTIAGFSAIIVRHRS
jgi:hypothetical protein